MNNNNNYDYSYQQQGSSNKKKRGLEALAAVLQHEETSELTQLRQEVQRLRMLENIQIKTVADEKDIFYWFNKINDLTDTTTIDDLKSMRDFILDNSIEVVPGRVGGCRYSLVGGEYELMGSILKACERYDKAVLDKQGNESAVVPQDWQWERNSRVCAWCWAPCLCVSHLIVQPTSLVVNPSFQDFPTTLVRAAALGEDVSALAARRDRNIAQLSQGEGEGQP